MSMTARFLPLHPDRMAEAFARPGGPIDLLFPDDDGNTHPDALDIDKTWHAIHFLLTRTVWEGEPPLSQAILGGDPVGDDTGFGPARYLSPAEVREVAAALVLVPADDLRRRYGDGSALTANEIYPSIWDEEGWDYVSSYYVELVAHYERASQRGDAMLLFLV